MAWAVTGLTFAKMVMAAAAAAAVAAVGRRMRSRRLCAVFGFSFVPSPAEASWACLILWRMRSFASGGTGMLFYSFFKLSNVEKSYSFISHSSFPEFSLPGPDAAS